MCEPVSLVHGNITQFILQVNQMFLRNFRGIKSLYIKDFAIFSLNF